MNLSPHFTLEEFAHSDTALRLGIDNTPSAAVIENGKVAAAGMEEVRRIIGVPVHVNSWHRCEALERVLCAKDFAAWCARHGKLDATTAWPEYFARKQHPQGFSIDFTAGAFGTPSEVARKLIDAGLKFDQLILEGTWVHVSFGPQMRQQVLTATFTDGTPAYTQGVA